MNVAIGERGHRINSEITMNTNKYSLHGQARQRVINSHISRYWKFVSTTGDRAEFENLIDSQFINSSRTLSYCTSVYISLLNKWRTINEKFKKPFPESHIRKMYNAKQKRTEYARGNKILYDGNGDIVAFDDDEKNVFVKFKRTTHIDENDAKMLKNTAKSELDRFLSDPDARYNKDAELYLLVCLLSQTGMRKGELFSLTIVQCEQLILGKEIEINTKNGPASFIFGTKTTQLLYDFIQHPSKVRFRHERLFVFSYTVLRRRYKQFMRATLKKTIPNGVLFHSWRTMFAKNANAINPLIAQQTLHHKSYNMTGKYVQNQLLNDRHLKKRLLDMLENK